ncbi:LPXTG-motif cell wall-anchored protein [Salirhabdus euzebyi]|uniref:LPXTG-motif cell wall-anchored protein n=1 Tax=Salirhabdus euzebyi TaxID=394506 RepID=A0A841Q7R0_9BACI|nr:choice-of-anchor L domain-containing protein [Salirhabdus euzebyi]MBB6454471.1 LPXTG-motif cell wall-anchored protein [Salirhabdus euzebyi]
MYIRKRIKKLITHVVLFTLIFTSIATNLLFFPTISSASGGLGVDIAQTKEELVNEILGSGVIASEIKLTGNTNAFGIFGGGNDIVGFENGIILSTGNAKDVIGPNIESDKTTRYNSSGDSSLTNLAGFRTYDAATLEFTFVPSGNYISFQYVFSSEEYNEYANSDFNDIFAFFVNGENVALLPDSNTPVSINTVNGGNPYGIDAKNEEYFINNEGGALNTEMDGLTVVMSVSVGVNPGVSNTIKLAIADGFDDQYDSNVFIKAGSLNDRAVQPGQIEFDTREQYDVTIKRSGGSDGTASATWVAKDENGTTIDSGTVKFGDGETEKVIKVPSSTKTIELSNPIGGAKIYPDSTPVLLEDIPIKTKSIESANPVIKSVPHGTSVEEAKLTLGMTVEVSLDNGQTTEVPIEWSVNSNPDYNGNQVGAYLFTGTFGQFPDDVDNNNNVQAPTGTINVLSNSANIESFSFGEQTKPAEINSIDGTVFIEVENGTALDQLIATFVLSDNAQGAEVDQVLQESGQNANNFTNPVKYKITAQDGTVREWIIIVEEQGKTEAPIPTKPVLIIGEKVISGTSEANAQITIKRDENVIGSGIADGEGKWSVEIPEDVTIVKEDILSVTAKTQGKVESDLVEVTVIEAPAVLIESPTNMSHLNNLQVIKGSTNAPNGSSITIEINGTTYPGIVENNQWTSTSSILLNDGHYTAEVTISDRGVVGSDTVSFTVDTTKPIISLKGSQEVQLVEGNNYIDDSATAVDNIDGDVSNKILVTGIPVHTDVPGNYTITYNVSDKAGNNADAKSRILVIKPKSIIAIGSADGENTISVNGSTPGATINLYDKDGKLVASTTANLSGEAIFTGVTVGLDYQVTQTVNEVESNLSNKVTVGPSKPAIAEDKMDNVNKTVEVSNLIPGATVTLLDKDGNTISTGIANDQGKYVFANLEQGVDYLVTQTVNDVTSEEKTFRLLTFEQEVDDTLRNLKIGFQKNNGVNDTWESVTSNVYLLRTDNHETDVVWTSNDSGVVKIDSSDVRKQQITTTVNRQQNDKSVTITATVSKGNVTKTRTFLLVIKAAGIEKKVDVNSARQINVGNTTLTIERINVINNSDVIGKIDKIIVTDEIVEAVLTNVINGIATIQFPVNPSDVASEFAIEIDRSAITAFANEHDVEFIKVENTYAQLVLSKEQLLKMSENNLDLFFRLVPITEENEKQQVRQAVSIEEAVLESAAGKKVNVLGTPIEIETNYRGFETEVTFPLEEILDEVTDPEMLRVFIEHADEKVIADSEIVYDVNNNPIGIKFKINKFSTFTIYEILNNNDVPVEEPKEEEPPVDNPKEEGPIEDKEESPTLPNTSTNVYNLLSIGLVLLSVGIVMMALTRRKKKTA